jgi:hypothetical protein
MRSDFKSLKEKKYRPSNSRTLYDNTNNGYVKQGIPFDTNGNPLPEGWERVRSSSTNKYYYFNKYTFDSQWDIPYIKLKNNFGQNKYSPREAVRFSYSPPGLDTEIQHLPPMVGWRSNSGNTKFDRQLSNNSIDNDYPDLPTIAGWRSNSGNTKFDRQLSNTSTDNDYPDLPTMADMPTIVGWRSNSGNTKFDRQLSNTSTNNDYPDLPTMADMPTMVDRRSISGNQLTQSVADPVETIIVQERCCDEITQYPKRMCDESVMHTLTATGSMLIDPVASQDASLDGIVEIRNQNVMGQNPQYQSVEYIRKIDPYLSDHDGIVLNLNTSLDHHNIPFNIISMNLEGFCRISKDKEFRHINNINSYFEPHIKRGTIIAFQEIVLQTLYDVPLDYPHKHNSWVDKTGIQILSKLRESNPRLRFVSDTYTSGIFYDNAVWELEANVSIKRKYKDIEQTKFSNAYLFRSHFDSMCKFWVVNIHLKAPNGTQEQKDDILDILKVAVHNINPFNTKRERKHYVDNMHITELNNIVGTLKEASDDFNIPVYLCGDYNSVLPKGELVTKAMQKIENFTINNDSEWEFADAQ